METKNTLMSKFLKIQETQLTLDKLSKEIRNLSGQKRSLAQKLPQMLRELNLK